MIVSFKPSVMMDKAPNLIKIEIQQFKVGIGHSVLLISERAWSRRIKGEGDNLSGSLSLLQKSRSYCGNNDMFLLVIIQIIYYLLTCV